MQAVALPAGKVAHPLLLVRALEVERRGVGARVDLALAHHDRVLAPVGDLLPEGPLRGQAVAALVDVGQDHALADAKGPRVGLVLAHDHAEERRLPRAVGPDDAHDPAPRQDEAHVVHQQVVPVALAQPLGLDDQVA